jgi:hypothetical protein
VGGRSVQESREREKCRSPENRNREWEDCTRGQGVVGVYKSPGSRRIVQGSREWEEFIEVQGVGGVNGVQGVGGVYRSPGSGRI